VGWVVTCRSRGDDRLFNVWLDDHTRGLLVGLEPVAVFDLWEHAYLLDFNPAQRPDYLRVLLDNMNWDVVESRCV
jgi:Fe-Mn family superoxide dismutase